MNKNDFILCFCGVRTSPDVYQLLCAVGPPFFSPTTQLKRFFFSYMCGLGVVGGKGSAVRELGTRYYLETPSHPTGVEGIGARRYAVCHRLMASSQQENLGKKRSNTFLLSFFRRLSLSLFYRHIYMKKKKNDGAGGIDASI